MKIHKVGEKLKGGCDHCKKLVTTTFQLRNVPVKSGGVVDNLLCSCCDHCGNVVSIPHQSVPRIKELLDSRRCSVEVRLPRHLVDILVLAVDRLTGSEPDRLKDTLIRYYINLAHNEKAMVKTIQKFAQSNLVDGETDSRLSLKVNSIIQTQFNELCSLTGLSKSLFIKGLILQINDDILQKKKKARINELSRALMACG